MGTESNSGNCAKRNHIIWSLRSDCYSEMSRPWSSPDLTSIPRPLCYIPWASYSYVYSPSLKTKINTKSYQSWCQYKIMSILLRVSPVYKTQDWSTSPSQFLLLLLFWASVMQLKLATGGRCSQGWPSVLTSLLPPSSAGWQVCPSTLFCPVLGTEPRA